MKANDLMKKLEANPEWVAARAKREEEQRRREAALRVAEAPLVEELRAAGFPVASVWDLVNTRENYPGALPILLAHLTRDYPAPIRDGIARALAVREAKFAWGTLVGIYREEPAGQTKDALAVSLSVIADDKVVEEMMSLVRDARHGPSRALLLGVLQRSSDPRAHETLRALATDRDLKTAIKVVLRRIEKKRR